MGQKVNVRFVEMKGELPSSLGHTDHTPIVFFDMDGVLTVNGRQYHASMPSNAISAARDGMEFMLSVDKTLHSKYTDKDDSFNFPYSTFEPTKHEKNVDNINTIPGKENS